MLNEASTSAVLEVIDRTGECADTYALSYLLALGYIVEHHGRLCLTLQGKSLLKA